MEIVYVFVGLFVLFSALAIIAHRASVKEHRDKIIAAKENAMRQQRAEKSGPRVDPAPAPAPLRSGS